MTDQQKHNIRAAFGIWKRNDVTDTEFVEWLDKILSLPAQTQDGTAEEENKAISELYKVASSLLTDRLSEDYDEWKSVSTTVPKFFVMHVIKECSKHNDKNNIRANMIADSIKTLRAYVAPLRAEIERLKKDLDAQIYAKEHFRIQSVDMQLEMYNTFVSLKHKEDELAAANQQIAGLVQTIESHREQRELDRICYENKLTEANQRVKELEEKVQAKEVLLIGYRDLTEGMI